MLRLTGEDGADFHLFNTCLFDGNGYGFGDFFASMHEEMSIFGMCNVVDGNTAQDAFRKGRDDFITVLERGADKAAERSAVLFVDDDIVRNIDKTAGEVSGVGGFQGGVGQTFTGTVSGDEVFEHRHAFLKVGEDGVFDGGTGVGTGLLGLGHQTTHTGELGNLVGATTRSGIEHHEHGVEALVGFGHLLHEGALDVTVHLRPSVDNLVVAFVVGDEAHTVVAHDLVDAVVAGLHDGLLLFGNDDIVEVERKTTFVGFAIT